MAYFIIENFARGIDFRKSKEVAPAGSLRVLNNAFVNEGGEIEKRKSFTRQSDLTTYGQNANYKGKITGPHECPGYTDSVFFRHRHNSLPGGSWTAGAGTIAEYIESGTGINTKKFWAAKSTVSLAASAALLHATSYAEFSNKGYIVENFLDAVSVAFTNKHIYQTFTNDEPTSETEVTANADRDFQFVLRAKGYVVEGKTLYASAVNDPSDMAGTGSGNLDLTTQGRPIGDATALADYFGQLAIFGRRGVQFFTVDADFSLNQYQRTIAASVFAPRTILGYADGDVIFLGKNGIRSLQARDSSNLARVSDLGSPIDKLLQAELKHSVSKSETMFATSTEYQNADYYNIATAIVHPETGQLWVCLKDKIYVLSRFPAAGVQGWSVYQLPSPQTANLSDLSGELKSRWCADICTINDTLIYRNFADEVYLYGGDDGETYDSALVEVEIPHIDMGRPGHNKTFNGIDLVCEGKWKVQISTTPYSEYREENWTTIAEIDGSTRTTNRVAFESYGPHISLRLTCNDTFAAKISQISVFYDMDEEK